MNAERRSDAAPLVSIIVPLYNKREFIRATVLSLLNQTYRDIEVIVVDDGSTDDSRSMLSDLRDSRLTILHQHNQGVEAARNKGFNASVGQLIVFHDADDLSAKTRIARQVRFLQHNPEVSILGSWARVIGKRNRGFLFKLPPGSNGPIRFLLMFESVLVMSSVMIRREALVRVGAFKEGMGPRFVEDYDLWSRALKTETFANLRYPVLKYRTVADSKTRSGEVSLGENARELSYRNLLALTPKVSSPVARDLSRAVYGPLDLNPRTIRSIPRLLRGLMASAQATQEQVSAARAPVLATFVWASTRLIVRMLLCSARSRV